MWQVAGGYLPTVWERFACVRVICVTLCPRLVPTISSFRVEVVVELRRDERQHLLHGNDGTELRTMACCDTHRRK